MTAMTESRQTLFCLIAIVVAVHAPILNLHPWGVVILTACCVAVWTLGLRWAIQATLLAALATTIMLIPLLAECIGRLPVLSLLIPLLVSTLITAAHPSTRQTLRWMKLGQVSANLWVLVGLTGLISATALLAWASWTENLGIGERMMANLSNIPTVVLALLGIPLFAISNAATEEMVFRGVLQTALLQWSPLPWLAIAVQAAAFAAIHYEMGFPNGPVGYGMVFVYGLVLGYFRMRTGGLLAPITAHIVADLVIGMFMLARLRI